MSWHCSQEQEEDFSLPIYLAGIPSPQLNWSPTPAASCCADNKKDTSLPSPSGMTSEPSTPPPSPTTSTSSPEGSPAKTSAPQVKVADLPETVAACGSSISAALKPFALLSSSRKTVRSCVPVASAPSSKDLTAWGMTFGGACWEQGTSARPTTEIECGSWPTPKCEGWRSEGNQLQLIAKIDRGELTVAEAEAMAGGMLFPPCRDKNPKFNRPDLQQQSHRRWATPSGGGVMNSDWTEWLMGWPIGWTAQRPLETAKFQQWLSSHFTFLQGIFQHEPHPHHYP